MKIKVSLTKHEVTRIFEFAKKYKQQTKYLFCLYRLCLKKAGIHWDKIEKYEGYPKINKELGTFIFDNAIKFDREFHPGVMSGGLILNNGFSSDEDLPENTVIIETADLNLKN